VKKAGGYFILFLLLFSNLSLSQLVKLPVLVQHYKEHKQRDQNVGLLDFLAMHYWGKDLDDNDQDRDDQLPFKAFQKVSIEHFSTPQKNLALKAIIYFNESDFPVTGDDYLPNPQLGALFKPPQSLYL